MIDLRTDTVTRPTDGMRQAVAHAEVGDEQKGEDPTTRALEERVAALVGSASAVFVPSATMANQIALQLWSRPGDAVVVPAQSHLVHSEAGGPAALAGLMVQAVDSVDGTFDSAVLARVVTAGAVETPRTALVCVENTHSNFGGRVWPLARLDEVLAASQSLGVRMHLDGARLLNAAVATRASPARVAEGFDSVTVCLSKGLGCPLGALLAVPRDVEVEARRIKQRLGGAMRQSGMLAAAGIYALDHHVERLADDHARARRLAGLLADSDLAVDVAAVESNVVVVDVAATRWDRKSFLDRLRAEGVLLSALPSPSKLRAVTHLDIEDADIEDAARVIRHVAQEVPQ
ncbi:GntG family PLP-dependent aldolase [Mycobacterium sp. 236(2023)]|uniref:threonine aldolase family protein n=1 Tax=Mycobacterium sp. 236(2023) TaxID=3038163 RepID=UPI0024150608|nr:GntG family PLP-dependent aldolase [Mycobacterium sp. 236(2023)]MDG4669375.1 GntG family PLP-dependent aldolase [Mycobacterium sp. 236(2023)]